jgi:hypothetical protein
VLIQARQLYVRISVVVETTVMVSVTSLRIDACSRGL